MRKIKFRARRIDGKTEYNLEMQKYTDLVYGSLFTGETKAGLYYLIEDKNNDVFEVKEGTICQYTGCKDENGKELYEGDTISLLGETYKIVYDTDACAFVFDKPFLGPVIHNADKHTPIGIILKIFAYQIEDRHEEK